MWWLTEGKPSRWPLVHLPHALHPIERHELPLVEFLVRWLSGELPGCFGGVGGAFAKRGPDFLARRPSAG
jgi:hypothetical protein